MASSNVRFWRKADVGPKTQSCDSELEARRQDGMFSSRKVRPVVRIFYAYLLIAILSITIACHSALAAPPVEEYGQRTIDQGTALLKDPALSGSSRKAAMRTFLSENFDVKRIALFALGDAAASASPQELVEYLKSFETLTLDTYVSMIGDYGGAASESYWLKRACAG